MTPPTQPYLPFEESTAESQARQTTNRRSALLVLMSAATSPVDLVLLAGELELDAELDELAATSPERQRLLELARAQLDEELPPLVERSR